jgi:putative ABC transport system substrate-binding protein
MRRRAFHRTLAAIPVSVALGATAQSKRPLRVAWVSAERKDRPSQNYAAFRTGMRELGYAEGRDLYINTWWGGGSRDQLESLVPEMLRAQPDVLLASGGLALGALIRSGVKLPIVFSVSADPVAAGFVQTFARPGANMTGVSLFTLALVGKRLEILKDILPGARTVALIANPQHPGESQEFDAAKGAAARLGLEVRYFPVKVSPNSMQPSPISRASAMMRSWLLRTVLR